MYYPKSPRSGSDFPSFDQADKMDSPANSINAARTLFPIALMQSFFVLASTFWPAMLRKPGLRESCLFPAWAHPTCFQCAFTSIAHHVHEPVVSSRMILVAHRKARWNTSEPAHGFAIPQSTLGSKTPLRAMKDCHKLKPKRFKKRPCYLPACDIYGDRKCPTSP